MPDSIETEFLTLWREAGSPTLQAGDRLPHTFVMISAGADRDFYVSGLMERDRLVATPRAVDLTATAEVVGWQPPEPPAPVSEPCPACNGTGEEVLFVEARACPECKGAKKVPLSNSCKDIGIPAHLCFPTNYLRIDERDLRSRGYRRSEDAPEMQPTPEEFPPYPAVTSEPDADLGRPIRSAFATITSRDAQPYSIAADGESIKDRPRLVYYTDDRGNCWARPHDKPEGTWKVVATGRYPSRRRELTRLADFIDEPLRQISRHYAGPQHRSEDGEPVYIVGQQAFPATDSKTPVADALKALGFRRPATSTHDSVDAVAQTHIGHMRGANALPLGETEHTELGWEDPVVDSCARHWHRSETAEAGPSSSIGEALRQTGARLKQAVTPEPSEVSALADLADAGPVDLTPPGAGE